MLLTLDGVYRDCQVIRNVHFESSPLLKRVDNSEMNLSIIIKQVPCYMPVRYNWIQMFSREILLCLVPDEPDQFSFTFKKAAGY